MPDYDWGGGRAEGSRGRGDEAAPAAPPRMGTGAAEKSADAEARGGWVDDSYVAPRQQNNLGTQYGETRYSPVTEVSFTRARSDRPDRVLTAYYDDARGLAARGIYVRPEPWWQAGPAPFPYNDRRFAPPPP
jgi:hypothetical protein